MADEEKKASPAEEMKRATRGFTTLAIETLAGIMNGSGQDSVKLAAAREILDRAYGKPKPAAKPRARKAKDPAKAPMTVIVKRFSDVTAQDEAEHDATEAMFR